MRKGIIRVILYLWQLPQHLIALLLEMVMKCSSSCYREKSTEYNVFIIWSYDGAMSLGNYIFLPHKYKKKTVVHECNHCRQSKVLGPLYLLVIGMPSIIHAGIHTLCWDWFRKTWNYYKFYTEHWMFKD